MDNSLGLRLNKALSQAGVGSRRLCDTLIFEGRICVNGLVIKKPNTLIHPDNDILEVDQKKISKETELLYFKFHKPIGYICSHKSAGKTVYDFFSEVSSRLFTVGRLDKQSSGLIIVTNDGALSQKLAHPKYQISKEYLVKTDHFILDQHLKKIAKGCAIEGKHVLPKSVTKIRRNVLKVVVTDGRKHEERILLEEAGLKTLELCRTRIGNLRLGKLLLGAWKAMSEREIKALFEN
jgi:23S rRNA pseudouridine2605 synthase